ncbi:hypothetical protein [Falsiroseomonas sp.]|uniref:alpha-glutamyl/putrescinyl thymine pyrophosphorylase clade 3 protein n=1 Tax=Falsiroseomonas sp. TaxID=2870721 RepID=UPI003F71931D
MSPKDIARAQVLQNSIIYFDARILKLPGTKPSGHLDCLVRQFIDSLRRVEYAVHLSQAKHDPRRMDPSSDIFDPLRAAVLKNRKGEIDEAWWLVFLATHFGKHHHDGWRLVRDIYGRMGQTGLWDWKAISKSPAAFKTWLNLNYSALRGGGTRRRFSNHRKYETLDPNSPKGTSAVFESYVAWIANRGTHTSLVQALHKQVGQNPEALFEALYHEMDQVQRFGRLGKFDFLAMLGKLGIAPVHPGSTFLVGATGPLAGARLLLTGNSQGRRRAKTLDAELHAFGQSTGLGMQVLEDALCNWQKSPAVYRRFTG